MLGNLDLKNSWIFALMKVLSKFLQPLTTHPEIQSKRLCGIREKNLDFCTMIPRVKTSIIEFGTDIYPK